MVFREIGLLAEGQITGQLFQEGLLIFLADLLGAQVGLKLRFQKLFRLQGHGLRIRIIFSGTDE